MCVLTVVPSEVCNFVNNYLILTYELSLEREFSALQYTINTKSRAEYPFSSSVHTCFTLSMKNVLFILDILFSVTMVASIIL